MSPETPAPKNTTNESPAWTAIAETEKTPTEVSDKQIETALNNPDFNKFLEKFNDIASFDPENDEDRETIVARYELLKGIAATKKTLSKFYSQHISRDAGVELGEKELGEIDKAIGEHLSKKAIEDAEKAIENSQGASDEVGAF